MKIILVFFNISMIYDNDNFVMKFILIIESQFVCVRYEN